MPLQLVSFIRLCIVHLRSEPPLLVGRSIHDYLHHVGCACPWMISNGAVVHHIDIAVRKIRISLYDADTYPMLLEMYDKADGL